MTITLQFDVMNKHLCHYDKQNFMSQCDEQNFMSQFDEKNMINIVMQ